MKHLFSQLRSSKQYSHLASTYQIGLLQTRAFKTIMGMTSNFLGEISISNSDWVALGLLKDSPSGLRSRTLAEMMGVEQPFITVTANRLVKRGYMVIAPDTSDSRAKIISLTKKGKEFVAQTEKKLSKAMEQAVADISYDEAEIYLKVQQQIVGYTKSDSQS